MSKEASEKWRKKNRSRYLELSRNRYLINNYKINLNDYRNMDFLQDSKCAICFLPESHKANNGQIKCLSVDHNHSTGEVRELLCDNCNAGIARFKEDTELFYSAINYLNKHNKKRKQK